MAIAYTGMQNLTPHEDLRTTMAKSLCKSFSAGDSYRILLVFIVANMLLGLCGNADIRLKEVLNDDDLKQHVPSSSSSAKAICIWSMSLHPCLSQNFKLR